MPLRLLSLIALLVVCHRALPQVRPIDPSWVSVSQPKHWTSPPRELHLNEKTGPGEVIVLFPNRDYGYVACYLIRGKDGRLSISRGDGFVVKTGKWERKGEKLTVTSRTVYMTVLAYGRPMPSQPEPESFSVPSDGQIRRDKDYAPFRRTAKFIDIGFLANLISCDRLYYDGQKPLDGPHPCMPSAAVTR